MGEMNCEIHDEEFRFHCTQCKSLVCDECVSSEGTHSTHKIQSIKKMVENMKSTISTDITNVLERITRDGKLYTEYEQRRKDIKETFATLHNELINEEYRIYKEIERFEEELEKRLKSNYLELDSLNKVQIKFNNPVIKIEEGSSLVEYDPKKLIESISTSLLLDEDITKDELDNGENNQDGENVKVASDGAETSTGHLLQLISNPDYVMNGSEDDKNNNKMANSSNYSKNGSIIDKELISESCKSMIQSIDSRKLHSLFEPVDVIFGTVKDYEVTFRNNVRGLYEVEFTHLVQDGTKNNSNNNNNQNNSNNNSVNNEGQKNSKDESLQNSNSSISSISSIGSSGSGIKTSNDKLETASKIDTQKPPPPIIQYYYYSPPNSSTIQTTPTTTNQQSTTSSTTTPGGAGVYYIMSKNTNNEVFCSVLNINTKTYVAIPNSKMSGMGSDIGSSLYQNDLVVACSTTSVFIYNVVTGQQERILLPIKFSNLDITVNLGREVIIYGKDQSGELRVFKLVHQRWVNILPSLPIHNTRYQGNLFHLSFSATLSQLFKNNEGVTTFQNPPTIGFRGHYLFIKSSGTGSEENYWIVNLANTSSTPTRVYINLQDCNILDAYNDKVIYTKKTSTGTSVMEGILSTGVTKELQTIL